MSRKRFSPKFVLSFDKVRLDGRHIKKIIISAGALLIFAGVYIYSTADVASQAIRFRLKILGESIYEYHAATGHWPGQAEDLARTSMAVQMRFWQEDIQSGGVVVIWPQNLKPNLKDNADRILAYYRGGLISSLGNWVCWGDLRTEYLPAEKLQAALQATRTEPLITKNSKLETQN